MCHIYVCHIYVHGWTVDISLGEGTGTGGGHYYMSEPSYESV